MGGHERLLQAGQEDGVDLRGGGEVVGLLGGGEGTLEGDGGAVGSAGRLSVIWFGVGEGEQ